MKAQILHESKGRMRIALPMDEMSLEQADLMEQWFKQQPWAMDVKVHERTCCMIINYRGAREQVIHAVAGFSWKAAEEQITVTNHSARAINREYQEKMLTMVGTKVFFRLFMPAPIRIARACWHMVPFLHKGLSCIIHRQMKVELLDALSIGISVCRRDFSTADTVMFLLRFGELLEEWTHKRSVEDLAQCMSLNVDRVWIKTEEGEVLVPISQVVPGDRVVVRAGSAIPVDGVVVEGEAVVNQASLTGESTPVPKHLDSTVYAGTIMEEGECVIEVKRANGESRYDQIISMIEDSQQLKSAAETKAANLADKLVPYTLGASLLGMCLTGNPTRGLSVLMVDFSCALKLAMPLAVLSAMREAGKRHITVKGGKFLEAMAQADTIVFDKTGTLTHACPQVAQVVPFSGQDEREMLRLAACLEEHFPHSLANAVVEEANRLGIDHQEFHTKVEYLVAHGISSMVNGVRVQIGSAHFIFEDEGCIVPPDEQEKFDALPNEYSHLYMAAKGRLIAVICISDPLREEAADVLKTLKALGIKKTVMLTGDNQRTACAIASELGVDDFRAEVLPADKAEYIADLRAKGHGVIMVGDGINDSPALSEADVGISISDGAALAREISDITISADDLWELAELRMIAMGLMRRINSNYRFIIGFNGSLIVLGLLGVLTPAASAALHNTSTLAISLRSMSQLPEAQTCTQLRLAQENK